MYNYPVICTNTFQMDQTAATSTSYYMLLHSISHEVLHIVTMIDNISTTLCLQITSVKFQMCMYYDINLDYHGTKFHTSIVTSAAQNLLLKQI